MTADIFRETAHVGIWSASCQAAKIALLDAIRGGTSNRVSEILDLMGEKEAAEALATFDLQVLSSLTVQANFSDLSQRESLIMHACLSGDVDVFDTVLRAMEARLTNEQVDGYNM